MLALEVQDLHKTYLGPFGRKGHDALRGVNLSVPRGTAFGLIGANGAGKTTFIKTLLGIVRPTRGTVRVLGGAPDDPAVRRRLGYLPERLHLPGSWTPPAFLSSVARLRGLTVKDGELDALLVRMGLGEARGRRIGGFSKGMRQRLGLAAALLGGPELLVLDEPTDGIDPMGRVDVRRILTEELARGATLFLNSHLLAETERICGRVGILANGLLVREGALDELRRQGAGWRVRFGGSFDRAALEALGFAASGPEQWTGRFEDAPALNAALDKARALGALLLELSPERGDLESVLAQALGEAA